MIDVTDIRVAQLDLARERGMGEGAELLLLTHSSTQGYSLLADDPVPGGWTFEDGADGQMAIFIVEHDWVVADVMQQVRNFAVDGKVYAALGEVGGIPVKVDLSVEWRFFVAPTGEDFEV